MLFFSCLVTRAQDAGLIFLSAIASSVVAFSREEGLDEAGMLSTGEKEAFVCLWTSSCGWGVCRLFLSLILPPGSYNI